MVSWMPCRSGSGAPQRKAMGCGASIHAVKRPSRELDDEFASCGAIKGAFAEDKALDKINSHEAGATADHLSKTSTCCGDSACSEGSAEGALTSIDNKVPQGSGDGCTESRFDESQLFLPQVAWLRQITEESASASFSRQVSEEDVVPLCPLTPEKDKTSISSTQLSNDIAGRHAGVVQHSSSSSVYTHNSGDTAGLQRSTHGKIDKVPSNVFEVHKFEMTPRSPRTPQSACQSACSRSHIDKWQNQSETLIILDWDDTLCPTTYAAENPELNDDNGMALDAYRQILTRFLRDAGELGIVAIVTMASSGWLETCIKRIMPELFELFAELGISVTHARSSTGARMSREAANEGHFGRERSHYLKTVAMKRTIKNAYSSDGGHGPRRERSWKNILSIGDSEAERLALQDVVIRHQQRDRRGIWKECRCKTVLLKKEPTLKELSAQLEALRNYLPTLVHHDGDQDLDFDGTDFGIAGDQ